MTDSTDVVVIGGGISGLAAALHAIRAGRRVTLIEPHDPGGVVRTRHLEGFTLEAGPNVLLEKPALSSLIDQLGLRSDVIYPRVKHYRQYVWADGAAQEVPKSPGRLLCSTLFSIREKVRIIRGVMSRRALATPASDENIADFFGRAFGARITRRVIDPVLKGIYGGSVNTLSARSIFPGMWNAAKQGRSIVDMLRARRQESAGTPGIFVLRSGMKSLVDALVRECGPGLDHLRERVVVLHDRGNSFECELASGRCIKSTQVVVATAAQESAAFLSSCDPVLAAQLDRMQRASLLVVHCRAPQGHQLPRDSFGVLFPEGTPDRVLGVMNNSFLFPHLAPAGHDLFTVCIGGASAREQVENTPDAEVHALVSRHLQRYFNLSVEILAIHRWVDAIPQYEVGHWKVVEGMRECERRHPGLLFCGVDSGGVGVPDRVRLAMESVIQ